MPDLLTLPVNPLAARVVRGWAVTREEPDRYEAVQVGTGRRVRGGGCGARRWK